jgi:hypothetical protein
MVYAFLLSLKEARSESFNAAYTSQQQQPLAFTIIYYWLINNKKEG